MTLHRLEIERNAEGNKLALLSPVDDNGEITSGYRIAGPKAWGGSYNLARIDISSDDLAAYIKDYAPDVLAILQEAEGSER